MLGIIPPEPLGESPPFPISRLTKSRPLFCGMENWGGGLVNVAPTKNQAPASIGKDLKATFILRYTCLCFQSRFLSGKLLFAGTVLVFGPGTMMVHKAC